MPLATARKLPLDASIPEIGKGEPVARVSVPSGLRRYVSVGWLGTSTPLTKTNVPCAAGVGVGVAPGGVGIGVGVGVGLGVFALTPPHPARNAIISRPRTSTLQAETDLFIDMSPTRGR